jgi:hypothetical protein
MKVNQRANSIVCLFALFLSSTEAGLWSRNEERKTAETTIDEDAVFHDDEGPKAEYGVDVSWPMHYAQISTNYDWLPHNQNPNVATPPEYEDMPVQPLGDRQQFYKDFLQGCRDHFGSKAMRCTQNELDRVAMSLRQPQSMANYTDVGFKSKYRTYKPGHVGCSSAPGRGGDGLVFE